MPTSESIAPRGERRPSAWSSGDRESVSQRLRRRYVVVLLCGLSVLTLDQLLKALVTSNLGHGRVLDVLGGLVRIDFTRNTGAAFGTFQSQGVALVVIALTVTAGIFVYARRIARSAAAVRVGLGLILGGALGNLVDRLRFGYVIDYVDLRWWYVFNLADTAIVLGVVCLVAFAQLGKRDPADP